MASFNPYDILDTDEEGANQRRNKPKKPAQAPVQAPKTEEKQAVEPTEETRNNRGRGGDRGRRNGGRGRGGRDRKPRGGEGRQSYNNSGGSREPRREHDRQSGTGRGKEVRKPNNMIDELTGDVVGPAEAEPAPEQVAVDQTEQPNEEKVQEAGEQQPEFVPEPEPVVFTYDEYLAKQRGDQSNELLGAKQEKAVDASEFAGLVMQSKTSEDDEFVGKGGKKKGSQRSRKAVLLEVDIHHAPVERGGRGRGRGEGGRSRGEGGRGEGRRGGRGGRGRGEHRGGQGSRGGLVDISSASDFPSL